MEPRSSIESPPGGGTARGFTLLATNVVKLSGAAVVLNELLLRGEMRPIALAVAAFMMAGAEASEKTILAMIDRIFAR